MDKFDSNLNIPVGGHEYLDVASRVETVELVDEFQHRPLHFVVTAGTVVEARTTDSVNLVKEDNARLLAARHLKELSDHPCTLSNILLHKLGTDDPDESCVCSVCHCTCTERFASTGRTEEQHTLWRVDAKVDETFRLCHR